MGYTEVFSGTRKEIIRNAMRPFDIIARNTDGNCTYIAGRHPETGEVHGFVFLWGGARTYKDMHESMGPYYYGASAKVLDALSPTDNDRANEWRQKCREALKRKPEDVTLPDGDTARFAPGDEHGVKFVRMGRRRRYIIVDRIGQNVFPWTHWASEKSARSWFVNGRSTYGDE